MKRLSFKVCLLDRIILVDLVWSIYINTFMSLVSMHLIIENLPLFKIDAIAAVKYRSHYWKSRHL